MEEENRLSGFPPKNPTDQKRWSKTKVYLYNRFENLSDGSLEDEEIEADCTKMSLSRYTVLHTSSGQDSISGGVALLIHQRTLSSISICIQICRLFAGRISLGKTLTACNSIYLRRCLLRVPTYITFFNHSLAHLLFWVILTVTTFCGVIDNCAGRGILQPFVG